MLLYVALWLAVGVFIGWLASVVMKPEGRQGTLTNGLVGSAGAALGGSLISPLVGIPGIEEGVVSLARSCCR